MASQSRSQVKRQMCASNQQFVVQRSCMSSHAGLDSILNRISNNGAASKHRAAIALGSNMGDRVGYIEGALRAMSQRGLKVLDVSNLYQTKAMYYEDQDSFVNGACSVETEMSPLELLDTLQDIENSLGRVRKIEKGPRTLDLDILLYDDIHIVEERLEVPHKLMLEREFVLRPLADILPHYTLPVSFAFGDAKTSDIREALAGIHDPTTPMYPITALAPQLPLMISRDPQRSTKLMSIMNITPDSFSDGGRLSSSDIKAVQKVATAHIEAGAQILDIGGQSTRPHAQYISASEELKRVLPVIEAVRGLDQSKGVAISIDTFHAQVAREALRAGADIVNDVSGGLLDGNMLQTVADLDKTIILMHMRGDPKTMNRLTEYPNGVIQGVADELARQVDAARQAGIKPWRIILDPGIGFAKTQAQNLDLLLNFSKLRDMPALQGMPWLLGVSRKGFIGNITGVKSADKRGWGTAAAVTASIAGGSDIVRVHDVEEMSQVIKMADAIYRSPKT